jgi:hypothetical protein
MCEEHRNAFYTMMIFRHAVYMLSLNKSFVESQNYTSIVLFTHEVVEIAALQLVVWVTDTVVVAEVAVSLVISIGDGRLVAASDVRTSTLTHRPCSVTGIAWS